MHQNFFDMSISICSVIYIYQATNKNNCTPSRGLRRVWSELNTQIQKTTFRHRFQWIWCKVLIVVIGRLKLNLCVTRRKEQQLKNGKSRSTKCPHIIVDSLFSVYQCEPFVLVIGQLNINIRGTTTEKKARFLKRNATRQNRSLYNILKSISHQFTMLTMHCGHQKL